jgi:hypothetical protein
VIRVTGFAPVFPAEGGKNSRMEFMSSTPVCKEISKENLKGEPEVSKLSTVMCNL